VADREIEVTITNELHQVVAVLEKILERKSRWNGQLNIVQGVNYSGAKRYDCSIHVREDIALHADYRWRTLIHEALHSFSPAYNRFQYTLWKGWEEGVVEKLQRMLRHRVLDEIGITVLDDTLEKLEAQHPFNGYISVLDSLQVQVGLSSEHFYLLLLETELPKRAELVRGLGENLADAPSKAKFTTSFLVAHSRLTREEHRGSGSSD